MSNDIPVFVFDSFENEIQVWDIDAVLNFLNESSDQLYFSLDKEIIEEQKRLLQ